MNVIVDTTVWSLALGRNEPVAELITVRLARLIAAGRVVLLGAIRQEVLSGIREYKAYINLRDKLRAFPDLILDEQEYETAATYFNTCRSRGVQGANTDSLICAAANRHDCSILTTDKDFNMFSEHIPVNFESS